MFFQVLKESVRERISKVVKAKFEVEAPPFSIEVPPQPEFGDLALTVAFPLAKSLRKPPRAIAEGLLDEIKKIPGVSEAKVEGGGYLNIFLDRTSTLRDFLKFKATPQDTKIIVEHTNINPNKAAHIGHLRNSVLGDTLVRMLRGFGHKVEAQNYIDDTGVQVADVVVGFEHIEKRVAADLSQISGKFDFYCWDLYKKVGEFYEADKTREKIRQDTLLAIEHGGNPTAELAAEVANRIIACHLKTMERLKIYYDLLPRESNILKLKFWDQAFQLLKDKKAVYLCESGKNKGCWVMASTDKSASEDIEEQEKVIVRSNGTVTYVGKDIAYQLWKFGLLGKTFNFRKYQNNSDGTVLWDTVSVPGEKQAPDFGGAKIVYNVIDNRQSYLQKIVKESLKVIGYEKEAEASIHFDYAPVALSPAAATELGFTLSAEDRGKSSIEMSGRKGLGVKADDLLDKLFELSRCGTLARNPELPTEKLERISHQIGEAALRYFMLKHGENHVLVFDFAEALAFEGETGPYLQNAVVRAKSILRKFDENSIAYKSNISDYETEIEQFSKLFTLEVWEFLLSLMRIDEVISDSISKLQLSSIAKYAFSLAQRFHNFYHHNPMLHEKDAVLREMRLFVSLVFIEKMSALLGLMGIEIPERM